MDHSRTTATTSDIAESLSPVEFDTESESFQATYDSARDSTSLAVVAVVATVLGSGLRDLTPLQSVVETDVLDTLAAESATVLGTCDSISFPYEGLEVTVSGAGVIEANPIESA